MLPYQANKLIKSALLNRKTASYPQSVLENALSDKTLLFIVINICFFLAVNLNFQIYPF